MNIPTSFQNLVENHVKEFISRNASCYKAWNKLESICILKCTRFFKGILTQIKKALINDNLGDSKVSRKFRIPIIYNFAVIYS